jgi:hypothetical protein
MPINDFLALQLHDYMELEKGKDAEAQPTTHGQIDHRHHHFLLSGGRRIWGKNVFNKLSSQCAFLKLLTSASPSSENLNRFYGIKDLPSPVKALFSGSMSKMSERPIIWPNKEIVTVTQCAELKESGRCPNKQCALNSPGEMLVRWPQVHPFDPIRLDFDQDTLKCAIAILQKLERLGVSEFQARDAHRLVRGT